MSNSLYWFKQVFVANHTSMIDFIVLEQMTAFAVIMQKHPGWVGKILLLIIITYPIVRHSEFRLYYSQHVPLVVAASYNFPLAHPKLFCVLYDKIALCFHAVISAFLIYINQNS